MVCELVRDYRFEAAHRLPMVPDTHKCFRLHGHSYRVAVTICGPLDATLGWVMDFAAIDRVVDPFIAQLDHRLLNEIEGLENPTSEILAVWLWDRVKPRLAAMTALSISETDDSRCTFRGH